MKDACTVLPKKVGYDQYVHFVPLLIQIWIYVCVNLCLLECIKIWIVVFSIFGGENIGVLKISLYAPLTLIFTYNDYLSSVRKINVIKNQKTPVVNGIYTLT